MPRPPLGRSAGLVLPLFSLRSDDDWGIGEIGDLPLFGGWLRAAGFRALQLLPVSTLPPGEASPYSALSAMAIDPVYIALDDVHDFAALGGQARLPLADQVALRIARTSADVNYTAVRQAKESALRLAFSMFWDVEWIRTTARAGAFAAYASWEDWWLGDYALYCALRERHGHVGWQHWPDDLRTRDPAALDAARRDLEQEILFHQFVQWLAESQWEAARERLGDLRLFGDFPFMVSADSADVWAHQHLFRFDATIGTPPDAFSETGQDWGLPMYRWDVMAAEDYRWLRQRARRMSRLYDGYRVDHLVGFFRTYARPAAGVIGAFEPAGQAAQIEQGERILRLLLATGAQITAEDLGLIPDFVRHSLATLEMPGYKVLRWERDWDRPGQPFVPPSTYTPVSVATTSTHDIEPIALWWEIASVDERRAFAAMLAPEHADTVADAPFGPTLRDAILALAYDAGSNLLLLPMQDVFGWPDRINVPATVAGHNWRWRVPLSTAALTGDGEPRRRAAAIHALTVASGRL
jgi:4-alpha-glucanotransferase